MVKAKPPVITDPMAFIRGATEAPNRVVIGDKAGEIEAPAPVVEAPAPVVEEPLKPKPAQSRSKPDKKPVSKHEKPSLPWDDANPKVKVYFQLRMPEPLGLKLKFIKQNTLGVDSVHDLVMQTLEAMANERIANILQQQGRAGR